jgi:hypothetical protein
MHAWLVLVNVDVYQILKAGDATNVLMVIMDIQIVEARDILTF